MYSPLRSPSGKPAGGTGVKLQDVSVGADRVIIRPSTEMRAFSAIFPGLFVMFTLTQMLNGSSERQPAPLALCAVFAIFFLAELLLWYVQGRSVTIDENGVEYRFLIRKRRLSWARIHDYGLSYAYWGQLRLYFSEERLESNGEGKKRIGRKQANILLHLPNRNKSGQILNVCRKYTRIRPFLCSDEGKLTGVLRDR
jgi:hypothetical protein